MARLDLRFLVPPFAAVFLIPACSEESPAVDAAPACLVGEPDGAPPEEGCPAPLPPADQRPDRLDETLELGGLDRCTLGYEPGVLQIFPASIYADGDRLPWYDVVWATPMRALQWSRRLIAETDAAIAERSAARAILAAAARLGYDARSCDETRAPAGDTPLADAVAELIESLGGNADLDTLRVDAAVVPLALQLDVAAMIQGVGVAAAAREQALADVKDRFAAWYYVEGYTSPYGGGPLTDEEWLATLRGEHFDYTAMYRGAVALAWAIERHANAPTDGGEFEFRAATPVGDVVVSGSGDDVHPDGEHVLMVVDIGGNDTYTGSYGATPNDEHGLGVVVDLGGNDVYGYTEVPRPSDTPPRLPSDEEGRWPFGFTRSTSPRQGSGILGIGMVYDLGGGEDRYRSLRNSQGFGALGVGVLVDDGGDDIYESENGSQGAAAYGIGVLLDLGGADERRLYNEGQGFGYVRGVGMLLDGGTEGDVYWAEPNDVLYPSAQLATGNTSMAQGAGFGRRNDADGIYQSGGLGLLRDAGGADEYTVSVFGQGTGYWFGTGILADAGGDDSYDGEWYVQGSAAHFALCLFLEDMGNDRYNQNTDPSATSIGVGHDFSVGVHVDLGGDDLYRAPGLSLGAGNSNGIGVLLNVGGDDEYHAAGEPTIGVANLSGEALPGDLRESYPTQGFFLDVGGVDVYDVPGSMVVRGDDTTWTNNTRNPPITTEHSGGLDRQDGDVLLP